jgi:hypothetical protein
MARGLRTQRMEWYIPKLNVHSAPHFWETQYMGRRKPKEHRKEDNATPLEKARDELLSHIIHCGVLQAEPEQQKDWFDDTMEYMAERHSGLTAKQLASIREVGEQYCRPVRRHESELGVAK